MIPHLHKHFFDVSKAKLADEIVPEGMELPGGTSCLTWFVSLNLKNARMSSTKRRAAAGGSSIGLLGMAKYRGPPSRFYDRPIE